MPVLERQHSPLPPSLAALPPRSVPETAPTRLQKQFVPLSAIALIAGAIAITAIELGAPIGSLLVKLCAAIAAPILLATTGDAATRIWRSVWAWMPVDRGRAWFRLAWVIVALVWMAIVISAAVIILSA